MIHLRDVGLYDTEFANVLNSMVSDGCRIINVESNPRSVWVTLEYEIDSEAYRLMQKRKQYEYIPARNIDL